MPRKRICIYESGKSRKYQEVREGKRIRQKEAQNWHGFGYSILTSDEKEGWILTGFLMSPGWIQHIKNFIFKKE